MAYLPKQIQIGEPAEVEWPMAGSDGSNQSLGSGYALEFCDILRGTPLDLALAHHGPFHIPEQMIALNQKKVSLQKEGRLLSLF